VTIYIYLVVLTYFIFDLIFYMVLILHLNVLYGLLPCTTFTYWLCITEVDSVYCAVRTEFLYKADTFRP